MGLASPRPCRRPFSLSQHLKCRLILLMQDKGRRAVTPLMCLPGGRAAGLRRGHVRVFLQLFTGASYGGPRPQHTPPCSELVRLLR